MNHPAMAYLKQPIVPIAGVVAVKIAMIKRQKIGYGFKAKPVACFLL